MQCVFNVIRQKVKVWRSSSERACSASDFHIVSWSSRTATDLQKIMLKYFIQMAEKRNTEHNPGSCGNHISMLFTGKVV